MKRPVAPLVAAILALGLIAVACTPAAPAPVPTASPPAPTKAPAAPTSVPTATKVAESNKAAEPTKAPTPVPTAPPRVSFPEKGKSVTIVVGVAAGGGGDIGARLIAPGLEKELGIPVQVVNKAGASTQIAMTEVAQSKPDGYTIALVQLATFYSTYMDPSRKAVYTGKDFQPVANFASVDNVMSVKPDSSIKDLKDLVDAAKAKPGQVTVGTGGLISNSHLVPLKLEDAAGVRFSYVHFSGGGEVITALLGNHVDAGCGSVIETMAQYKSRELRILATFGPKVGMFFTDVKTAESQGYKVYNTFNLGFAVRAGTPMEIVKILSAALKKATENEDVKTRLASGAMQPDYMDTAEYTTYWNEYEASVRPLIEREASKQK